MKIDKGTLNQNKFFDPKGVVTTDVEFAKTSDAKEEFILLKKRIEECENALILMVKQYCRAYQKKENQYSHMFMTAGETAFDYLTKYNIAKYCGIGGVDIEFLERIEVKE